MARSQQQQDKWRDATRDAIERLDIKAIYQELGVEITGHEPSQTGWLECRAFGRDDKNPSSAINITGDFPTRGRYKDFVTGDNFSLFEFAFQCGKFTSWTEARDHYIQQAGLKLPTTKPPKSYSDALKLRDYNSALVASWCLKKGGVSEPAVKLFGGKIATENKETCLCVPIFGEHLTNDSPTGSVLWNITGKNLTISQGKDRPRKAVKMKTVSGSKSGWMGRHGLEHLDTAEFIWITEGPSDAIGLITKIIELYPSDTESINNHAVICNSGGANELPQPEFIAPLTGKTVIVIPDCDEPGQIGCRRRAEAIADLAHQVRWVKLPFEITPSHGKDLRDYFATGKTFQDLLQLVVSSEIITVTPPTGNQSDKPDEPTQDEEAATISERQVLAAIGLEVLGEMSGGRVKIFSEYHRKTDVIEVGRLDYQRLIQIAGPPAKSNVHQGSESVPGMHSFTAVKESIALLSGYRRVEEREVGPGCWLGIDDEDNTTHHVVLVGSGEAAVANYHPGLTRITKPRHGGRLLDLSASSPWYDFARLSEYTIECVDDHAFATRTIIDAENLFSLWAWQHQIQSPKIIAGLSVATWIQTLWQWRPQIAINGRSNSGKSTLFRALAGLYGSLALCSSQSTAAGIRQAIAKSAVVVLLDEFDSSKHRTEILEMLRASGRGDRVLRGTVNHRGAEFQLQHIVWTAGIESGLRREPDRNRFIQLELTKPPSDQMGKLRLPPASELHDLGQRLLAIAITKGHEAIEAARQMQSNQFPESNERLVECYAVPAACYALAGEHQVGNIREVLQGMLGVVSDAGESIDDSKQLLEDILSSEVDISGGVKKTVGQIIDIDNITDLGELERKGIRKMDRRQGQDYIFLLPRQICRTILNRTEWGWMNIEQILMRVQGAERTKQRIAGANMRGICIPVSSIGVEIKEF